MKYLVDSDWLIDAFGGVASAIQTLALLRQDAPAVSIVSYGELFDGGVAMPDPEQSIAQLRAPGNRGSPSAGRGVVGSPKRRRLAPFADPPVFG